VDEEGPHDQHQARLRERRVPQHQPRREAHRRRASPRPLVRPQVEEEGRREKEDDHHLLARHTRRGDQVGPQGDQQGRQPGRPLAEAPGQRIDHQDRAREEQEVGGGHGHEADAEELEVGQQDEGVARWPRRPLALRGLEALALGELHGQLVVGPAVRGERRGKEQYPDDPRGDARDDHGCQPAPAGDRRQPVAGRLEQRRDPVPAGPQ
jgi:hypothetical protein